ncbi:unnamed protein product [Arctia plantaginis]|uniref:Uncharacterized protein n=1 Tax=Arctia plantaginis TaxID=874455 RepID=A0A8S0ZIW1_ARCPL|nr:unnamed protein product [Arctia plantaginis]
MTCLRENRAIRNEEIKKELFVGMDDDMLARLAEPQTLQPLMLPVTSRGIGMATVQLSFTARQYSQDIRVPDIYAQYRVYLGLLEAKILSLKSNFTMIPRYTDSVYQHEGMTPSIIKILRTCTVAPVTIKKIVDAVGVLTHDERVYLPVVAKTVDAHGDLIPRPENIMLSSLRETVEALSDAETPLVQRTRFQQNCPIPGAIWRNDLLMNLKKPYTNPSGQRDSYVQFVYDNADHNTCTIDGKNIFHAMGGIMVVTPASSVTSKKSISRLKQIPSSEEIGDFGFVKLKHFENKNSDGLRTVQIEDVLDVTDNYEISSADFTWTYSKFANNKSDG